MVSAPLTARPLACPVRDNGGMDNGAQASPRVSRMKPLNYADRCARYLPQRGIPYDPERMSIGRLTPRQRRRALKKERHAFPAFPVLTDIDDDPYDGDEYDDEHCSHCGGEWYL